MVDTDTYTVTAYTPHLSRYLLGFQEKEVIEEPDVPVPVATSTPTKKHSYGTRIERPVAKVLGVATTTVSITSEQLQQIAAIVEGVSVLLERGLYSEEKKVVSELLVRVYGLLEFMLDSKGNSKKEAPNHKAN